jgi:hypothetical protein
MKEVRNGQWESSATLYHSKICGHDILSFQYLRTSPSIRLTVEPTIHRHRYFTGCPFPQGTAFICILSFALRAS